jgi:hypothetical protein
MSLKFAAKVHIYDRSGFTKLHLVPPCGASFLMQQTRPTITCARPEETNHDGSTKTHRSLQVA